MAARLGVNIDHVATLRQARGEVYPSIAEAAKLAIESGADQITIHLREDRRHIQDFDVPVVGQICRNFEKLFNLEIGATQEMVDIALDNKPDWVCLVPEKREEKTTEGGLDLINKENYIRVETAIKQLKASGTIKVSPFVEADLEVLKRCVDLGADSVEIHTGEYAIDFNNSEDIQKHLDQYQKSYEFLKSQGVGFHAGHGLTLDSVKPLVTQGLFEEYNIGHWIIAQSVFDGLGKVIKQMKAAL